jgi:hypothetical protein
MAPVWPSMRAGLPPSLAISGPAAASVSSASGRRLALSKSNRASPTTLRRRSQPVVVVLTALMPFGTWMSPGV